MHNIDRTTYETYGEYTGEYTGEFEAEGNGYEFEGDQEFETYGEYYQEGVFSEADEMELASELLAVSNEAELEQFLGGLLKKASQAVGGFLKSDAGHKLLGAAKNIAKQALPTLGGMAGDFLLPGVGGVIGSKAGRLAGNMLGLELEGLSYEDQEFEISKQLIRLFSRAAANAGEVGPNAPAMQTAQAALTKAAQQFAPGLLTAKPAHPGANGHPHNKEHQGRWIRRGNTITLIGV